jgi:hypothetical protein
LLSPGLIAPSIQLPCGGGNLKLFCDEVQNRHIRLFILSQNPTRISEIAHQNGDTKAVVIASGLSHKYKIGLCEREQANQLSLVFGESQQLKAFCRSKKLATRHGLGCSENGGFQDNGSTR